MSNPESFDDKNTIRLLSIEEKLANLSEAEQDILKVIEISLQTSQHIQQNIPFTTANNSNNNKLSDLSIDLIITLQNIRNKIILQTDILNPILETNTTISENTLLGSSTKLVPNNKQQEFEDSFLLKQLNSLDSTFD